MIIPRVSGTFIFPTGQSCHATAVPACTIPINNNCQLANAIMPGFLVHLNDQLNSKLSNQVCCILANFQSIQTKSLQVKDYIIDHDIDILFINWTWVHDNLRDALIVSAATPFWFCKPQFSLSKSKRMWNCCVSQKSLKIDLLKNIIRTHVNMWS